MQNLFVNPLTTGEWLLSSLGWTLLSLGGWWAGSYALARWPRGAALELVFAPLGFLAAHLLIWRYGVLSGWPLVRDSAAAGLALQLAAYGWLALLLAFQVLCAVAILGAALVLV